MNLRIFCFSGINQARSAYRVYSRALSHTAINTLCASGCAKFSGDFDFAQY